MWIALLIVTVIIAVVAAVNYSLEYISGPFIITFIVGFILCLIVGIPCWAALLVADGVAVGVLAYDLGAFVGTGKSSGKASSITYTEIGESNKSHVAEAYEQEGKLLKNEEPLTALDEAVEVQEKSQVMEETEMKKTSGYITVAINTNMELVPIPMEETAGISNFWVDFEDGRIYVKLAEEQEETIGYYEPAGESSHYEYLVFDKDRIKEIGVVGGEIIFFTKGSQRQNLAYYNNSGSITDTDMLLDYYGIVNGDVVAGAAAFVAFCYAMNIKSKFSAFYNG